MDLGASIYRKQREDKMMSRRRVKDKKKKLAAKAKKQNEEVAPKLTPSKEQSKSGMKLPSKR